MKFNWDINVASDTNNKRLIIVTIYSFWQNDGIDLNKDITI